MSCPNQPGQGAARAKAAAASALMETWERCRGSCTAQGPSTTAQTLAASPAFAGVKSSLKGMSEQPLPQPPYLNLTRELLAKELCHNDVNLGGSLCLS